MESGTVVPPAQGDASDAAFHDASEALRASSIGGSGPPSVASVYADAPEDPSPRPL